MNLKIQDTVQTAIDNFDETYRMSRAVYNSTKPKTAKEDDEDDEDADDEEDGESESD